MIMLRALQAQWREEAKKQEGDFYGTEAWAICADALEPFIAEVEQLRDTNARLNRRCQLAEKAANTRVEDAEKRSKRGIRNYIYGLVKDDVEQLRATVTALEAEKVCAEKRLADLCEAHEEQFRRADRLWEYATHKNACTRDECRICLESPELRDTFRSHKAERSGVCTCGLAELEAELARVREK